VNLPSIKGPARPRHPPTQLKTYLLQVLNGHDSIGEFTAVMAALSTLILAWVGPQYIVLVVHDRATLRMFDPNVAFSAVRASRGKVVRAEPVAALYQQGRVHHIGTFPQLEDQMTNLTSISTGPRRGIRRSALMPWSGRSAHCWSSR
jgi:hypothetical protein